MLNKRTKEELQKEITIYWWNLGNKTLDFKGTYEQWFNDKNIKISNIKFPKDKTIKGLRFKFPLNTTTFIVDCYDYSLINGFNTVINTYLTYLGDKALFKDSYRREYKLNWGN